MPRVAIDARLRAYRGGGIAEHTSRLIAGLAEIAASDVEPAADPLQFDLHILDHRKAASPDRSERWFAHRQLWTPPHHRLESLALPLELALGRLGSSGKPDLLHSPDFIRPRHWRGASVITVHDLSFLRRPEDLTPDSLRYYAGTADASALQASLARIASGAPPAEAGWPDAGVHRSLRQADRVIAVSEHTRRELLALTAVDPAKLRVIPNAVHPRYRAERPAADQALRERLGLPASRPFLLFCSTIEPRKNISTLLEAYRQLLDAGRDIGLALAGAKGWRSEPVETQLASLGLEEDARFLGWVSDDDLAALYHEALALVHPAVDEGFGLSPAEAMACGKPVVASRAGSLPELIGEAGLLVEPEDAGAWAAAIGRLLDEPDLASELGERGPAQVAQLRPSNMAASTLAVYREAFGS